MKPPSFTLREDLEPFKVLVAERPGTSVFPYLKAMTKVIETNADASPIELAGMADGALTLLIRKARSGDAAAMGEFATIAHLVCTGLSNLVRENPAAFAPIAEHRNQWPMMRSTNPRICDPDSWLADMNLGAKLPLQNDKHSKWKPDDAADVALQLLNYLREMWRDNVSLVFSNKTVRAKTYLHEFNRASAPKWWRLAEHSLKMSYPTPETNWKLGRISTAKSRTSPGRKREEILSKIKARFLKMAPL